MFRYVPFFWMRGSKSGSAVPAATLLAAIVIFAAGCAAPGSRKPATSPANAQAQELTQAAKTSGPLWSPVEGRIMTRWAADVRPGSVRPEYPRPQMRRGDWLNLNGLWEYAIRPKDEARPAVFDGWILVPFPVESALSGVGREVGGGNRLWYRRTFRVPRARAWKKKLVILNFEASDWETTIWVNGRPAGTHRGGYDPFSFDITDSLRRRGDQEIIVSVWDPSDGGTQPRGKQVSKPRSIWYTAVTGMWATVWIEPVPRTYVAGLEIVPDVDNSRVTVKVLAGGRDLKSGLPVEITVHPGLTTGEEAGAAGTGTVKGTGTTGSPITIPITGPRLWSPDSPFLYSLEVKLGTGHGRKSDIVGSYFGLRKISLGKDGDGVTRLFLNNSPLFHFGTLDQGWWPDGLYAAPTEEALGWDLKVLKDLGFNMLRKHVKVEPRRFYYLCDRLGLMVWQDMPSGDAYIEPDAADIIRTEASAREYEMELAAVMKALANHPSIVMWVPFNEGWGQYDTAGIAALARTLDPTRLVDATSGWTDRGAGDVMDIHSYPGPDAPANEEKRAAVLGEFGGLGLPIAGHTWQDEKNWGYRSFAEAEALTEAYLALIEKLRPLIGKGLSAAIYTQTTDVEIEVNGLMTYDRAVIKMDKERVSASNRTVYQK